MALRQALGLARIPIAALLLVCLSAAAWSTERSASYRAALDSITTDELQQHVNYLADDAREGREAGTRGGQAAGDYLRDRLKVLGLRGAGTDGTYVQAFAPNYRNLLAMLHGTDPKLCQETIVIGAHYDHVGLGKKGSASGQAGVVHPGADDNASGTSALLELAQALTLLAEPPRRTILLAFWDAEEKGMLGSKHWIAHPTLPLEQVKLVVNLDMIGRLRNDRLLVFGTRSAAGLRRLVSMENESPPLEIQFSWNVLPNADYYPFFDRGIPVVMFHTDLHEHYHRPSDRPQTINASGMRRVVRLVFALVVDLANGERMPVFRPASKQENEQTRRTLLQQAPQLSDRLGASWDPKADATNGVFLTRVTAHSPAHKADLRPGDRLCRFDGREIRSADDLTGAILMAPAQTSAAVVRPGEAKPREMKVELIGKPLRVGIVWRVDECEPGTAILTHVVPGSPAARAGLKTDDRIYQVNGRDFAGEEELERLLNTLSSPIRLLVERNGQLRAVELRLETVPLRRAA